MRLAVVVAREHAERARRHLLRSGLIDRERRIVSRGREVEIPVLEAPSSLPVPFTLVEQEAPRFASPPLSFERLKRELRGVIGERAEMLRGGWELIGDVLIISLPEELYPQRREIGEFLLRFHPRARSVVARRSIREELRYPEAEVIAGDRDTTTLHREHGCVFRLDPCRVMFSAGNMEERRRMAQLPARDEVVLDMFAGVGQLSIPLAKHASPRKVLAIEKRPETYGFLKENISLNRLEHVMEARLGDSREVAPRDFANRVLMGYFFSPQRFLPKALEALKGGEGVIHYHTLVAKEALDKEGGALVERIAELGYKARIAHRRIIKSYAPKRWHAVYDVVVG
ncbi:MAG: class I SAM-dependent methyltransferase family protein [Euryarchaeota archaeon]|nr:class I SAM-dependent methyltransferase family protein [Euryarchaeota archaeon]